MKCGLCNQTFDNKKSYQSHVLCCEVIKKNKYFKQTNNEKLPSKESMYELIKYLMVKCDSLENEIRTIKQYTKKTKDKINVIDWLNRNTNDSNEDFLSMLSYYTITQDMLETIFKQDNYMSAMYYVFTHIFKVDNHTIHPLRSFVQKSNTIYYLDKNKEWSILSMSVFKKSVLILDRKLIKLFNSWIEKHKDDIENDDMYNSLHLKYTKIIMGDEKNMSREKVVQKLYTQLYHYLKCNIKSIIEYEYEF